MTKNIQLKDLEKKIKEEIKYHKALGKEAIKNWEKSANINNDDNYRYYQVEFIKEKAKQDILEQVLEMIKNY